MKTIYLATLAALAVCCGDIRSVWSQPPPGLMNFQGRLTDSGNNPLSGPHDFIFGVYDSLSGGTLLWTETQNAVPVANGALAAQLGSSVPLPASVFSSAAAYLQITVDGVALSPRQRLVTAPYAFNSDTLQGKSYAAFVSTDAAAQVIAGDKTFTGILASAQLRLAGGVAVSSESLASLGAGVRISSNVYVVGFSSAARYYGDGSALTGITVAPGAISNANQVADGLLPLSKLSQSGCVGNEIPKWNGSAWACAADAGGSSYTADEISLHQAGGVFSALPSSVTLAGNAFNGASQLVRLTGSGALPSLNGAALLSVSSVSVGAVHDASIVAVSGSKVSGNISGGAGSVANGVYTTGSYADPAWLTSIATAKVNLSTVTAALAGKLDIGAGVPQALVNLSTVTTAINTAVANAANWNTAYGWGNHASQGYLNAASALDATKLAGAVPQAAVNLSTVTTALAGKLDAGAQASSVANGVYTTGSYADPAWLTSIATAKVNLSTVTAAINTAVANAANWNTAYGWGNHASQGYLNAASNLDAAKLVGGVPQAAVNLSTVTTALAGKLDAGAQAASVANGVYTTGSYADPAWLTSIATAKVNLSTVTAAINTAVANAASWNTAYGWGNHASQGYLNAASNLDAAKLVGAVPQTAVNLSTVTTALALKANSSAVLANNVTVPQALVNLSTVTAALAVKLDIGLGVPQNLVNLSTVTAALAGKLDTGAQAASVANGVYTTGDQTIGGNKTFSNTIVGSVSGNADTVDGLHAASFFQYPGWVTSPGYDANTIGGNRSGFTYSNNAPWTGPMAHLDAGGYGLQFNASYSGGGDGLSFRTRNGDSSSWNGWNTIIHSDNIGSQSVNYAASAGYAGASSAWNAATAYDYPIAQGIRWKNYGTNHVIFDASNGTTPNGVAVSNTNSQNAWSATHPTLMGWNGTNTYGVRVDTARYAETAANASQVGGKTFNWSGQGGQPSWLWGGNDGVNMYVYNPSNFSVNYANSAANVTSLAGTWWGTNMFGSNRGAGSYISNQTNYGLQAFSSDGGAAGMSFHRGGAYAVNMGLDPDNVLRIGGWSAGVVNLWHLDMAGNQTLAGTSYAADFQYGSSRRIKKDITDNYYGIKEILKLRTKRYKLIDDKSGKQQIGLIAEEVDEVIPELVGHETDGRARSLDYGRLSVVLIEAVKEQQRAIEQLRADNSELKERLKALETK